MASTIVSTGQEIIPGYILRHKLGSGGYGEVWLAEAPGGLTKAIKIVFGSISDMHAANELRALKRILAVHHPFLLSLERIEIVDGQLIIITELADASLLDRLRDYQAKGEPGIPRDRLLTYMRDAAEALDFLCQRHDLQHLDVKPANLLLVADRVKVADFGLVKDIYNHSISMMSGMTPTYAAPELFDGRPGRYSDQYSLALVYHELLTGRLPFAGKSAAQIASDHLHRAPNLASLEPKDRPILNKALSKKPTQRYASCSEFVQALIHAGIETDVAPSTRSGSEARSRSAFHYAAPTPQEGNRSDGTSVPSDFVAPRTLCLNPIDVEVLSPVQHGHEQALELSPALFVGIGGTGNDMILQLRKQLIDIGLDLDKQPYFEWMCFDTDVESLDCLTDPQTPGYLNRQSCFELPILNVNEYRSRPDDRFAPISRRWLYNVPRTGKTEGLRPIGLLAFLDRAVDCHRFIATRLEAFKRRFHTEGFKKPVRVYLLASCHGGTGSALINEIAFLLHQNFSMLDLNTIVLGLLAIAQEKDSNLVGVESAAAVSCLSEISHFMHNGGLHPGLPTVPVSQAAARRPFDHVYLIDAGMLRDEDDRAKAIKSAADFLMMDGCSGFGTHFDQQRSETLRIAETETDCDWTPWLRTLSSGLLRFRLMDSAQNLATRLMHDALTNFISKCGLKQPDTIHHRNMHREDLDHLRTCVRTLISDNGWTALAWMNHLSRHIISDGMSKHRSQPTLGSSESDVQEQNLKSLLAVLAQPLNSDDAALHSRIATLLDQAETRLRSWLEREWLSNFELWSKLDTVFAEVSNALSQEADKLSLLAEKLTLKLQLSEADGANGSGEAWMVGPLHRVGALTLKRFALYVNELQNVWRAETMVTAHQINHEVIRLNRSVANNLATSNHVEQAILNKIIKFRIEPQIQSAVVGKVKAQFHELCSTIHPASPQENSEKLSSNSISQKTLGLDQIGRYCADQILRIASEYGWERSSSQNQDPCSSMEKQIEELRPKLLRFGGAKSNYLACPAELAPEKIQATWQDLFSEPVSILPGYGLKQPLLLCDGERIQLSRILLSLSPPTEEFAAMAKRLHGRADIDWPSIFEVLSVPSNQ